MPVTITIQGASAVEALEDLRALARELRPQTIAEISAARNEAPSDTFVASKSQHASGYTVPADFASPVQTVPSQWVSHGVAAVVDPNSHKSPSIADAAPTPTEKPRRKRRTKAEMAAYRAALAAGGEPDPEVDESDDGEDEAPQSEPQPEPQPEPQSTAAPVSEAAAVAALFDAEPAPQGTDFSSKTVADCQELLGRALSERLIAPDALRQKLLSVAKAPNLSSMDPAFAPHAYAMLHEIVSGSAL